LDNNIKLHNVINHNFSESIDGLINKYYVQMGEEVLRDNYMNDESDVKQYTYRIKDKDWVKATAIPDWIQTPKFQEISASGFDFNKHDQLEPDWKYSRVFTRYTIPIDSDYATWDDFKAPVVKISSGINTFGADYLVQMMGHPEGYMYDGFSINYEAKLLTFSNQIYVRALGITENKGEISFIKAPIIELYLWKETYKTIEGKDPTYIPDTSLPNESDINDLSFYTDKMGDYSETVTGFLGLSGFNKQDDVTYLDETGNYITEKGWDDTEFAKDIADWRLSQVCDKKVEGTIEVTLDTLKQYNLDLNKRIKVNNVRDDNLNIDSIDINVASWIATIRLKNGRTYKRTESIPVHSDAKNI
jgi:hypothetical protein